MTFNDYIQATRDSVEEQSGLFQDFFQEAQTAPRITPQKQWQQYQAVLKAVGSPEMVVRMVNNIKGEGEGQRYLKAMQKLQEKFGGE